MNSNKAFSFILYTLGFLLLWEWLLPLEQITKTSEVHYFIIFVVISLLLNFFQAPWFITWPIKGAFILFALYSIFSGNTGLLPWLFRFFQEVGANTAMVLAREWFDLSPLYRSLLFFLLLWQFTYLLRFWLTVRRKIFVFYVMTIIYVALLDTFTEYDGHRAIVRIVIIGFTLLGLLFFKRTLEKEQIDGQNLLMGRWMISLASMIICGVAIGYLSPKAAPKWPDPVPFIESKAESMSGGGISKIGYGVDDSQLGGPFINDDRVVFTVKTPTRQYWKIETKDLYTGKGWVASDHSAIEPARIEYGEELPLDTVSSNDNPVRESKFSFDIVYPHVVRPYGFLSMEGEGSGFFRYDPSLDKISSFTGDFREVRLDKYTIKYQPAEYSMKELRGTKGIRIPGGSAFSALRDQYTQLPGALPDRVRDLARDLTEEYDNWYDKARAIERHFQSGEFSYDQTRVAVPAENQDYVDQFLFDTKRGYCDNFSTSMVVMLRSLDIPARWVKGYAPGNYKGRAEDENRIYEVTNNEAHSWVEVFFPTIGWVPFEPTKGFNSPANIIYDEETRSVPAATSNEDSSNSDKSKPEGKEKEETESSSTVKDREVKVAKFFFKYWGLLGLVIIIISIVAVGLLLSRDRWIPHLLIWKYKNRQDGENITEAYETLLKRMDRLGLKRMPGQTLRNYASYIDSHFDTSEMSQLTEKYERFIYGGEEGSANWEYSKELWENLIKKTMN